LISAEDEDVIIADDSFVVMNRREFGETVVTKIIKSANGLPWDGALEKADFAVLRLDELFFVLEHCFACVCSVWTIPLSSVVVEQEPPLQLWVLLPVLNHII